MPQGLSYRAAALHVGCTHRAISKAVETGHLSQLPDGSVAPEALARWNLHRRTPRGGARRTVSGNRKVSTTHLVDSATYPDAVTVAATIEAGANDLALILLRHLPGELARDCVADWIALARTGWVGGPAGCPEPACVTGEWPPPPGCAEWHLHALFADPVPVDWADIETEAAAWRAERGLVAP